VISEDEAEKRALLYEKESKGSFVYDGITNIFGKQVW